MNPSAPSSLHLHLPLLAVLLASACQPARLRQPPTSEPSRPQATLHGVRMRLFRGQELSLVGRAARVSFHRSTRDIVAEEALLQFHPSGNPTELRAPELRGNLDSRGADLSGGVRLRGPSSLTGETERARFDGRSMTATGDRPVKLRGTGYAVTASSFQFNFTQESFDFSGDVDTRLQGASPPQTPEAAR